MQKLVQTFNQKKVLVTGHTGFKGSWLSTWLLDLGAEVFGISSSIPTVPSHFSSLNLHNNINDLRCDIRDNSQFKKLVLDIKPDFVFHLAAQSLVGKSYEEPLCTWQTNSLGTVNVLESLRELKTKCTAIFITSDKAYRNNEWLWGYRENDVLGGNDPYSASKASAELAINSYVHSFFKKGGVIKIAIGRAGNVIGGGDWADHRIVPDCARAWSKNEILPIRRPHATRPWQHVLEPLSGYLTLANVLSENDELHGEAFNFGPQSNQNYSVADLADEMKKHWDQANWVDKSCEDNSFYESKLLKLNCDKALHILNWRSIWDFNATIRETAVWYKTYYSNLNNSMAEISLSQIHNYVLCAKNQGVSWAK